MSHHIQQNPESAKQVIAFMNPGELKNTLSAQMAQSLAEKKAPKALQWGESLDDPAARRLAMNAAIQAYAQMDADAAFQYARQLSDTELQQRMLSQIGLTMASADPVRTAEKIAQFPETVRGEIIPRIAWSWARTNPGEAATWIDQIPASTTRDEAIREASQHLISANPSQAFAIASTVTDTAKRYGLMRDALLAWHRIDPEATQLSLASSSNLTDQQKDFLKNDLLANAQIPDLVLPSQ